MRLHREQRGDGAPVLLVHAGIADSRMWEPLTDRLVAAGRQAVACDLRGFGRSPLPPGPYSPSADLVELLDELGIERVPVIGASFGGLVALELALRAPARVTALALLDSALDEFDASEELEAFDAAEAAAAASGDLDEATAVNVRMWLDRAGRAGVDPAVRDLVTTMTRRAFDVQDGVDAEPEGLDPPVARRLGEIRVPALVLVGSEDVEDFHRIAATLAAALPGADGVVTIPDAAHLPALERPAEVAEALLGFLSGRAPA